MTGGRWALVLALALTGSVLAVFGTQVLTGFDRVTGDRLDGLIQISILEHWYNVVRGFSAWDTTNYFHPYRGTLAYNDGYLLYGLAYSAVRAMGADPFLSAEAVNVVLRVVGFAGAYRLARVVLDMPPGWAVVGAVMFTLGLSVHQHSGHAQVLSVAFGPWAAVVAVGCMRALEAGRRWAAFGWGAGFVVLAAAWLMTAFYMAWLLGLFALVFAAAALATSGALRGRAWRVVRRDWPVLLGVGTVGAVAVAPFLVLYLPKARESGMHSVAALRPYLPQLVDTVRVGPGNLLWGWSDAWLPGGAVAERIVGWPPVHLACFAAAAWSWRRWPARRTAVLAVVGMYGLTLGVGGASAWWAVYHAVPGAKAIRVVSRAWIVLAGPMLCVVLLWLYGVGRTRPWLAGVLAALLVVEQLSSGPDVAQLDRKAEVRRLAGVLPPPRDCRAFAVLSARSDDPEDSAYLQLHSPQANAMLLAEVAGLPTVSGMSTFNPPDRVPEPVNTDGYRVRTRAYAQTHGLEPLCGVDLRTGRWYRDVAEYTPVRLAPTGGPLSLRKGEAGEAALGPGWSAPEPWGRWGGGAAKLRFVPQGGMPADERALRLTVWAFVPRGGAGPRPVPVSVNGCDVGTWAMSDEPAKFEAVIPGGLRDAIEVNFADEAGSAPGGVGVLAIWIDWL